MLHRYSFKNLILDSGNKIFIFDFLEKYIDPFTKEKCFLVDCVLVFFKKSYH